MKTKLMSAVAALITVFGASEAFAQEGGRNALGSKGDLAIGAERLFGIGNGTQTVEVDGVSLDTDYSVVGFLWSGAASTQTLYLAPRVSIDYFPIDGLSVGGSVGYLSTKVSVGDSSATSSGFIFAPRVGYLLPIGDSFGFWPRGGFTYYNLTDPDRNQFSLGAQLDFVIGPTAPLAFTIGLVGDFGVTGSTSIQGRDLDYTDRMWGITFGMVGFL
jgi:hypothetical protein